MRQRSTGALGVVGSINGDAARAQRQLQRSGQCMSTPNAGRQKLRSCLESKTKKASIVLYPTICLICDSRISARMNLRSGAMVIQGILRTRATIFLNESSQ